MKRYVSARTVAVLLAAVIAAGLVASTPDEEAATDKDAKATVKGAVAREAGEDRVVRSEEEWRALLTADQFYITRLKGTERPFSGKFNGFKGDGIFVCVSCGNELFDSATKFESGTGWPSFWKSVAPGKVGEVKDRRYGMVRTEIICNRCDAHLGHLFNDGPRPTGLRYCVNSIALDFVPRASAEKEREEQKGKAE